MKARNENCLDARQLLGHCRVEIVNDYYSRIDDEATLDRWRDYLLSARTPLAEGGTSWREF